jgi:Bacterial Ig-like domain (group 3)
MCQLAETLATLAFITRFVILEVTDMPTQPKVSSALYLLLTIVIVASIAGSHSFAHAATAPSSSGCLLLSSPGATPAFCETFDQPAGIGNRSGDLDGTLWGVSRQLGGVNSGQNQYYDVSPTTMQKCGVGVQVQPPNDVAICNGQLVEAQTDQHGVTSLAMYPKQPFDIAGRTGTIAFDVSDDSHGNHRAWPELWYTDQPVPAPFDHFSSLQSVPRNGFGVRFAGYCPANLPGCGVRFICPDEPADVAVITVDSAVVVNNYVSDDSFMDVGTGPISVRPIDCVKASSGPGDMNHFELRVSQNEIDVYGTDAGTTGPLKEIAIISNMALTLTRGLVWLEDVHYNGDKDGPDQGTHTFTWDNVAFDGPTLPRDLAFDVMDRLTPVGPGYPTLLNLGWPVAPTDPTPLTLSVPGVSNIVQAAGALLTFNYSTTNPTTISYRVNNGIWRDQPWPFGACYTQNGSVACGAKTIAVPVALSDVQSGTNLIQFKASDYAAVSNVDLVLQGAGGNGCSPNCPVLTATALGSSENPANLGDAVALTASVTSSGAIPSGSVTFSDSGTTLGAVTLNGSGTATLTTQSLTAGTHVIVASYSGTSGFASSQSAPLSQLVNVTTIPTATTLAPSENPSHLGDSVAFTVTVTSVVGVPSGSVIFSDSGTTLATVPLNSSGTATFTTSSLTAGTHILTASYSGAAGFASSQSTPLSQVVSVTTLPTTRFDWESGALDGWQVTWGQSLALSNSTNLAYSGTHSLRIDVASAETHSAIDNETSSQLSGFNPGATVTLHIYNQNMSGVLVHPFLYNENWIPAFGQAVRLRLGWNTITYVIPKSFKAVRGVGVQINNTGAQSGTLYLDAVTTS